MSRRPPHLRAYLLLSAIGWSGFVAVTVWTVAFLAGIGPRTVDSGAPTSTATAIAVDLALLLLFAVQLMGLRHAGWDAGRSSGPSVGGLYVGGLHAFARHPLMTGLLLAFWATPHMGASHLLFALAATGYLALGVMFEERDLRHELGASYDEYAARVPALLPRPTQRITPCPNAH